MTYPLVIELKADGIPVERSCRVLGFSPQGFYKWCERPYSDRDWHDAHLVNQIIDIHNDDPEFGYRFIADELHKAGVEVSEGRVQRLCHEHKIFSVISKKGGAAGHRPGRQPTTTSCSGTSPQTAPTSCG